MKQSETDTRREMERDELANRPSALALVSRQINNRFQESDEQEH